MMSLKSKGLKQSLATMCMVAVVASGCGPKKGATDSDRAKPVTNPADGDVGGPAPVPGQLTVTGLKISEKETTSVVRIETSEAPGENYTVFKLTDPMRVVVDMQNSAMGEVGGPYTVGNGTVNEVSASFFEDEGNKVTRVMIGLDKIVEYTVQVDGNAVVVEIPREGGVPAVTEMGTGVGGTGVAMAESAPVTEAPVMEAPVMEMETPVMETPVEVAVAEPVMETPVEVAVAVAEPEPVMEATPEAIPEALPAESVPMSEPEPVLLAEATPEPTPEAPLFSEAPVTEPAIEQPIAVEPEPEPVVAEAPAPEPEPEPFEMAVSEPEPIPEATPFRSTPSRNSGGLVKMTGLDFKQPADRSSIIIRTQSPVSYEELTPEGNTVVLELKGVRVPKSLERALDTSEFKSAVKLISTYQAGDNARVVVQLREKVPYRVTQQDSNTFHFDFDRPTGMAGVELAQADPTPTPAEVMMEPVGEQPAMTEPAMMEPAMSEPAMAEPMMAEPAMAEPMPMAAPVSAPAPTRNGRPVETFLPDPSLAGARPLAGMQGGSEMETGVQKVYTGRKLNMDFKDADIHNVLRIIANVSKLNIVASDSVSGKVTLRLINVPWDQALDIILQAKKLDMQRQGNIIRIDTLSNFTAEREEKKKAKDGLKELLPVHTLLLPVSYAAASEMKGKLDPFLSKQGKINVDDRTNTLLIQDHREELDRIRELARTLDTQTPQVLIEARLVEARTSFSRTMGIQWGGAFNPNPTGLFFPNSFGTRGGNGALNTGARGQPEDNLAINLPGPSVASLALYMGSIGNVLDLDARLGALETSDDIKVVSSPRIATLDNKSAKISQGARIPFLSTSQAGTQTQFVDATLELNVTPHITADKSVFMTVQVRNNRPGAISVGGQPSIDIAEANTEVLVKDGDTTVIGGVYVVNRTNSKQGLPGLYKLPFIGFLFRASTRVEDRRELLVFLTPRIITRSNQAARAQ